MNMRGKTLSKGRALVRIEDEDMKIHGVGPTLLEAIQDAIDRFTRLKNNQK